MVWSGNARRTAVRCTAVTRESTSNAPLVLVADDATDMRVMLRFELEHPGFRVEEAASGREALEAVHGCHPDVLLLDLTMRDGDGWEVLKELRRGGCPEGLHIAVLTGQADEMVEQRARAAGANVYLAKPISGSDLTRALHRLLSPKPAAAGVA